MPKSKKPFNFSLGADPEFSLTMQGRKVDALETIQGLMKDKKNLKLVNMGYRIREHGEIGWDGMSATAEVRPSPSNFPQGVVGNLMAIFKEATKHLGMFDWMTVSEFGSLGGHIHFELPKGQQWSSEKKSSVHRKMASFYLPILMSENKTNLNLRIRSGYGSVTDGRFEQKFKYPDNTPGFTYEFRTPSAEWLTTPKIAQATIAYCGVVYNEILNHPRSFNKFNDVVFKSDKQGQALQTLSIMDFELLTKAMLNKIRKYIRTFEMYKQYKAEIEFILSPNKVMSEKLKADFNIVKGWGLVKTNAMPTKKDIMQSEAKISKLVKDKDIDRVKSIVNINYNDDTNIGLFVDALRERIAAFNWKLKRNYFVFGMRKGITDIIVRDGSHQFLGQPKQIKTRGDWDQVHRLFDRMERRFYNNFETCVPDVITIDFKTGKPRTTKEFNVIIGLPYELRTSKEVKPFLETIYGIEKGILTAQDRNMKESPLIDDYKLGQTEKMGEIWKIMSKEEAVPVAPKMANDNMARSRETIVLVLDEAETEERVEMAENQIIEELIEWQERELNAEISPNLSANIDL